MTQSESVLYQKIYIAKTLSQNLVKTKRHLVLRVTGVTPTVSNRCTVETKIAETDHPDCTLLCVGYPNFAVLRYLSTSWWTRFGFGPLSSATTFGRVSFGEPSSSWPMTICSTRGICPGSPCDWQTHLLTNYRKTMTASRKDPLQLTSLLRVEFPHLKRQR